MLNCCLDSIKKKFKISKHWINNKRGQDEDSASAAVSRFKDENESEEEHVHQIHTNVFI